MAIRRTVLMIGDAGVSGRPASELTAINAAYTNPQSDFDVWNIQAQAWQNLTPGTNSDSSNSGSDAWSFEARLREGLRPQFPTEKLYLIKHSGVSDTSDWMPQAGSFMSALQTQVTNAVAAAALAGDTVRIEAIVLSVQILDHVRANWRAYGSHIRSIIAKLRALTGVSYGSLRNDTSLTPTVVIEPHYKYAAQDGRLPSTRLQLFGIENEEARIAVVRSHRLTAESDGTFDALSTILTSTLIANAFYAPVVTEGVTTTTLGLLLGDSTAEGSFTDNTQLPAHQQAALSGAFIWNPIAGAFQTTQAGVNNEISWPNLPIPFAGFHGPEINFSDRMRANGAFYLVKATQINSTAGDWRGQVSESELSGAATPPFYDRDTVSWGSGRGSWLDVAISWMRSAIEAMRVAGKRPVLGPVIISLGLNDAIRPGVDPRLASSTISKIRAAVLAEAKLQQIDTTNAKFLVSVPPSYAINAGVPYNTITEADLQVIRADIIDLPNRHSDVLLFDLTDYEASDYIHPSTSGTAGWSKAMFDAYVSNTSFTVNPLFCPSLLHLKRALRLSKVSSDSDALAMIDNAVQAAKARFYAALGDTRISAILGIAYTNTPTTSGDYLRILAADVEIKIVRSMLMRSMPMSFVDGASTIQTWNEEAAFRESSYLQTRDELRRLQSEIEDGLKTLLTAQFSTETGQVITFPDTENAGPGESIFVI